MKRDPYNDHNNPGLLSSPQQLDPLLSVVKSKEWLGLLFVLLILIAIISWAFLSFIPVQYSCKGVITAPAGFTLLRAEVEGSIQSILVEKEEYIQANALLMELHNHQIESDWLLLQAKALNLQEQIKLIGGDQIATIAKHALSEPATLEEISLQVSVEKALLQTMQDLSQERLQKLQAELSQVNVALSICATQKEKLTILSHSAGQITQIDVNLEEYVQPGDLLLSYTPALKENEHMQVFAYIPLSVAGLVLPGQIADISIVELGSQYGLTFKGTVNSIATYPMSKAELLPHILQIEGNEFMPSSDAHVLEICIDPDFASFSGFSKDGTHIRPADLLRPGLVCNISITVDEQKPWEYLLSHRIKR